MSNEEYEDAIIRLSEISEILNYKLDDEGLDLFEEYCELNEKRLKAELFG